MCVYILNFFFRVNIILFYYKILENRYISQIIRNMKSS